MSWLFASGGQTIGASASASVFPMNIQGWFSFGLTCLIFFSPRDSQEYFLVPQFKSINSSVLSLLYGPTLTSVGDYWENHSFHYVDFCWQSDVWCTTICNSVFCVWLGRSLADLVWSWLATNGYRWDSLDNWSDSSPHSSHFWDQSVTWCCQYTLGQSPVSHTLGQSPPLNVGSTPSQGNSAAACREVQSNK